MAQDLRFPVLLLCDPDGLVISAAPLAAASCCSRCSFDCNAIALSSSALRCITSGPCSVGSGSDGLSWSEVVIAEQQQQQGMVFEIRLLPDRGRPLRRDLVGTQNLPKTLNRPP